MFQNTAATANISFLNATGRIDYNMTNDYMFRAVLQRSEHTQKHLIASLLHLDPDSIVSIEIMNPIILGQRFDKKLLSSMSLSSSTARPVSIWKCRFSTNMTGPTAP